jgi:hypothetical protein
MEVAQNSFNGDPTTNKKDKMVEGKPFLLHHCWAELKKEEKWRNHDRLEVRNKAMKATAKKRREMEES